MARIYHVDTAVPSDRKKRRKHKTHVVFDGSKVFKVGKLTELEDAGEIYVDALFPELYDEVLELLRRRGVRAYLLKDPIKLKKLRMEKNMKKSDENDAMLLSRIPREVFRLLTAEELELKTKIEPLIRKYRWIVRWKKILKRFIRRGFNYNFEEVIRLMEADRMRISREIIKRVASLPIYGDIYKKACEILGVNSSTELAILVLKLPLHLPLVRLKGFLGLIPGKNEGRYNHKLREHITNFAAALRICAKRGTNVSNEVLGIVNRLPKRQAIIRLELLILKALRTAYLMAVRPLAGE